MLKKPLSGFHPKLAGTPMLDMEKLRGCRRVFVFPEEAIVTLPETRAYVILKTMVDCLFPRDWN